MRFLSIVALFLVLIEMGQIESQVLIAQPVRAALPRRSRQHDDGDPLDFVVRKSQYVRANDTSLPEEESMHLNPAQYVIYIFNGVRATARAVGRSPSSVSKWQKPRDNRGCGGGIPSAVQLVILEQAKKLNLDITPKDLLFGRNVPKRKVPL